MPQDFSKIWAVNGTAIAPTDPQYLQGFSFLEEAPPDEELLNFLFQNIDLKLQQLNGGMLPLTGGSMSGAINEAKGADIASATTTSIGAATGNYVVITGTTTITSLGTAQAGTRRKVSFAGSLILTHNATSLILPNGVSIITAPGDVAEFISLGSGNWLCTSYSPPRGNLVAETVLGSAQTSITFSGLGAVACKGYELELFSTQVTASSTNWFINLNGDNTNANYATQYTSGIGTSVAALSGVNPVFGVGIVAATNVFLKMFIYQSHAAFQYMPYLLYLGNSGGTYSGQIVHTGGTDITSLTIQTTVASQIAAGTIARLYRRY